MDQNEARIVALESSIEILKKTTNEHGNHIIEIKKSMDGIDGMKAMLKKLMEKQGIIEEGDHSGKKSMEGEIEAEAHEPELEGTPREWAKKVELPWFEGSDPLEWVAWAEKFFEVQQVKPTKKVRLAFISMDNNVVH